MLNEETKRPRNKSTTYSLLSAVLSSKSADVSLQCGVGMETREA